MKFVECTNGWVSNFLYVCIVQFRQFHFYIYEDFRVPKFGLIDSLELVVK